MEHFEQMSSYLPVNALTLSGFMAIVFVSLFFIVVRYFGLTYLFYKLTWGRIVKGQLPPLHQRKMKQQQMGFEIKWSLISSGVFALSAYLLAVSWQLGWTQIYLPLNQWGWAYLPVSFLILSLIHEVYFYWTHVIMHRPTIYRAAHATHHHSIQVSPWASFCFHPYEAIVHALFLPLVVFILPLHPVVIIAYLTFMTVTAISNHLGFELLKWSIVQKHFISGTHHSVHHQKFNYNYGLYFTFMDRLFGTEYKETL